METEKNIRMEIYTDGSSGSGQGGWAYCILEPYHTDNGRQKGATNNQMELTAVLKALEYCLKIRKGAVIYSDSTYVCNGINSWMWAWKKKNWVNVKNPGLWRKTMVTTKLLALANVSVEVKWVKGHDNNKGNEIADNLAVMARKGQI